MLRTLQRRRKAVAKRIWRSAYNPLSTIVSVDTDEPVVGLTFDDGPDPVYTPRLLDLLASHGAKATFFMVGSRARSHPELVARVVGEGHAIANHTESHPSMPSRPRRERHRELRECQDALGPHATNLFRPPFGHQSLLSRWDAYRMGFDVVAWGSDVEDWLGQTADRFESRIHRSFRPGLILLLHDSICGGTDPAAEDRDPMLQGLDRALARAESFRFETLPDLFTRGRVHRARWFWRG
ncbi:MAG: polysaccharide deacetylase family protein [Gemmatimonadetes bacterium]|nr:polysaccharide deacetylase family protein [Gemmatimonadota bacterium]